MRIKQIDALITTQIIAGIGGSMQAAVTGLCELRIDLIRLLRLDEQVDALGSPDHIVRRKRETPDQGVSSADLSQRRDELTELLAETGRISG